MQRMGWMIAPLVAVACGGKKEEAPPPPRPKMYKLSVRADKEDPPGAVAVTITWPAGWTETELKSTGPKMTIPGASGLLEGAGLLLRFCPEGTEGAACIEKIVERLHDPAKTKITPVGDRRWVEASLGKMLMGSLFVYHAGSKTTVECQTTVAPENQAKLAEARKACEGLTL